MSLNCKQGDLAIIVKSYAGNEGKIVRCVNFLGEVKNLNGANRWGIDINIITNRGFTISSVRDEWLRPIRDSDKQDEMLSIVSLKEKVRA